MELEVLKLYKNPHHEMDFCTTLVILVPYSGRTKKKMSLRISNITYPCIHMRRRQYYANPIRFFSVNQKIIVQETI